MQGQAEKQHSIISGCVDSQVLQDTSIITDSLEIEGLGSQNYVDVHRDMEYQGYPGLHDISKGRTT